MAKCHDCDYPICMGCPYNKDERPDMWNDPDCPEFDPAEEKVEYEFRCEE